MNAKHSGMRLLTAAAWVIAGLVGIQLIYSSLLELQLHAAEPPATAENIGDTKPSPLRTWDPDRDFPPHVSKDQSVRFDYPVVYVAVPRPYPKEYYGINHLNQAGLHQTNAPGAELRLLHPDGLDELLVPAARHESITDPVVSFDGEWVYFAKFHQMAVRFHHMTKLRSVKGSDIYKVHVKSRKIVQLTHQQKTPNTGAIAADTDSHPNGVHNLAPCPVAGGRVVFCSDRNGYRGVREQTQPALQLFLMDEDGSNVELIGPLNLGTALHPVAMKDGRVMFSSLETQGIRGDEQWGIWAIHPDGTNWSPLTSALGSPFGQAVHFQAQLADESVVVESYYQTGSTDGFGTFWKFPLHRPYGQPAFMSGADRFAPYGLIDLTLFSSFSDVRPNFGVCDNSNRIVHGLVTHPAGAPDGHMLTTWSLPWDAQDQSLPTYDAGIYLIKSGLAINHPSKMRLIKNDPKYQELWPRALVPYKRIHGIDEPPKLVHHNDGRKSPHLPAGTPFGLVGTSSLYKRESYPRGVVPEGSVTAVSARADDRKWMWRELAPRLGNWSQQGADAGLYDNSDIWGIRIVALEPVSEVISRQRRHYALGSNGEERLRILGEFPVRKFTKEGQPTDPDGNPDTSFLAKLPADVAWTFQTLDNNGMVLNMAQTWHQLRPGEIRNDCGGCHAHSQQPTPFRLTAAARPEYKVWDLTDKTPLFTTKANDQTNHKWDNDNHTGVQFAGKTQDVEYYRDIVPIFQKSCVACHSLKHNKPAAGLVLDDDRPNEKEGWVTWSGFQTLPRNVPRTYARLAQYSPPFQSRRSPLIWKVYGRRLDGFRNEDIESPPLDYNNDQHIRNWGHHSHRARMDVDYSGTIMPPPKAITGNATGPDGKLVKVSPLTDEDKLTLVRWIDLGSPIDFRESHQPGNSQPGWFLDEGRPTLTLASPQSGTNAEALSKILIGMQDYYTGLDMSSFQVTADFKVNGTEPGKNLVSQFQAIGDGIWELKLTEAVTSLRRGQVSVSIKDRQGNTSRIERSFSIQAE